MEALQDFAHKGLRHFFADKVYANLKRTHRIKHKWNDDTVIAQSAAMSTGSNQLSHAYSITRTNNLSNIEAIFWICHRLTLRPTFLLENATCAPQCEHKIHKQYLIHGYHQAGCPIGGTTTIRHDLVLEAIAKFLRHSCGLLANTGRYLNKEYNSQKSTDLLIVYPGEPDRLPDTMDYTCHCPFLPAYRSRAARNFTEHMKTQARNKAHKHAIHCRNMNRNMIGVPGTTLGNIGTETFWNVIHGAMTNTIIQKQLGGNDHLQIQNEKQQLLLEIQSIIIKYTAQHIANLSSK